MNTKQVKCYINNKIWEYRWVINNLDMDDCEKDRFKAKQDALIDLLMFLKDK